MTTIREKIILEFLERAAVIVNTASPPAYETSIGSNVLRARTRMGSNEVPFITILPKPEEAVKKYGKSVQTMTIQVEGVVEYGNDDPSVIGERLLGDIIKCFTSTSWERRHVVAGSSPLTYTAPYAESISYVGGGVDDLTEGDKTIAGVARFQIVYETNLGDPSSQS